MNDRLTAWFQLGSSASSLQQSSALPTCAPCHLPGPKIQLPEGSSGTGLFSLGEHPTCWSHLLPPAAVACAEVTHTTKIKHPDAAAWVYT